MQVVIWIDIFMAPPTLPTSSPESFSVNSFHKQEPDHSHFRLSAPHSSSGTAEYLSSFSQAFYTLSLSLTFTFLCLEISAVYPDLYQPTYQTWVPTWPNLRRSIMEVDMTNPLDIQRSAEPGEKSQMNALLLAMASAAVNMRSFWSMIVPFDATGD